MQTTLNFESVTRLMEYCKVNRYSRRPKYLPSARVKREGFSVLNSWDEALDAILIGWPQGTQLITEKIQGLSLDIGRGMLREEFTPAVAGWFFDVGLVCSGHPECWLTPQNTDEVITSGKKIVRIGVNAAVSAGVSSDAILERGAAILALADLLEVTGRSVILTQYCAVTKGNSNFCGSVALKAAGEMLDIDSLAFWLVCPDSFRRCWFRVMETIPNAKSLGAFGPEYGFPVADYGQEDSDVFLPGIRSAQKWSRDDSISWICKMLQSQGVLID